MCFNILLCPRAYYTQHFLIYLQVVPQTLHSKETVNSPKTGQTSTILILLAPLETCCHQCKHEEARYHDNLIPALPSLLSNFFPFFIKPKWGNVRILSKLYPTVIWQQPGRPSLL